MIENSTGKILKHPNPRARCQQSTFFAPCIQACNIYNFFIF